MMEEKGVKTKREVIRVSGRLKEIITVKDEKGDILHRMISPLMVEFYPRDLMQVMIGATILAIPVAFTEEVWRLGETLPLLNVFLIMLLSILFISLFVYYNFYRQHLKEHRFEFVKRVALIYLFSFIVVSIILTLINLAPWTTNTILSVKRAIIVTLPASMSAAITDMLK
jgi:uncharacterized membrane protein